MLSEFLKFTCKGIETPAERRSLLVIVPENSALLDIWYRASDMIYKSYCVMPGFAYHAFIWSLLSPPTQIK